MNRFLVIIWFLILLVSCSRKKNSDNEEKYYNEFYSVLNEIVKDKYPDIKLIVNKTKSVFRTPYGNYPVPMGSIDSPPPPPPPGIVFYNVFTFMGFVDGNQLDSIDAHFMYQSIDSTKSILLDSTKINLYLIPESKIIEIFKTNLWDLEKAHKEIERIYGSKCFLEVSTPIFNSNFSKVLLTLESNCDSVIEEQNNCFILEKKDGKWKQVISDIILKAE
jgi:hypothetical protein